ncbi:DUF6350 family protein [Corynebacterium uropygiale]|uniref:DUF6350 family protein n=1 Tax=Corynebacterium uropygiale TaxID=1775911 RepID=A0A9X1QS32_9CORY|nr:DUF6350 family protein [Corynebacterium uropygiale]MCF4006748.1 DUF6350 family protein [Corynebacterium uropygiale]
MLSGTTFIALPATIAIGWLVTNLIPVEAGGVSIGLVPLIPALTLVTLLAKHIHRAVKDRVSIADLGVILGLVLLVPLVLTGIASLMLVSAGRVFDVSPPAFWPTVSHVLVLHLVALACGMGTTLWRALFRRYGIPSAVADDIRTARHFLARLCGIALLIVVVLLLVNYDRQSEILDAYHGLGALGVVGLILLSLLYLPHAIIATAVALVGGEFHMGDIVLSLFGAHAAPLPPLPLLAAMPTSIHPLATILLAIPAFLGAFTAWRHRSGWASALRSGVAAGIMTLIAGWLASGQLAGYGHVGALVGLSAGLVVLWLGGTGLIVAGIIAAAQWWNSREPRPAAEAEEDADIDDVDIDDAAELPDEEEEDSVEDAEDTEDVEDSGEFDDAADEPDPADPEPEDEEEDAAPEESEPAPVEPQDPEEPADAEEPEAPVDADEDTPGGNPDTRSD